MDLHECDAGKFNRESLDGYFEELCKAIDMVKCERYWWDDVGVEEEDKQTSPHTKGTSAVQFILTSTIVVHTLDLLKAVYVNIFSCKEFDADKAVPPNSTIGGWGKFVRNNIRKHKKPNRRFAPSKPTFKKGQQQKKGGRGWLHAKLV